MQKERNLKVTRSILINIIKHFNLITRHRWVVFKLCCKAGIPYRGLVHDLSKYSPTEFWESVKYYNGNVSPILFAKRKQGYSKAWLHHKGHNKHHYEYWIDYPTNKDAGLVGMKMPVKYVVEMFCDRVAASRNYNKEKYTDADALNYYLKGKGHYVIHPDTDRLLHKLLKMLAEHGEDYTFTYIRRHVLHRPY